GLGGDRNGEKSSRRGDGMSWDQRHGYESSRGERLVGVGYSVERRGCQYWGSLRSAAGRMAREWFVGTTLEGFFDAAPSRPRDYGSRPMAGRGCALAQKPSILQHDLRRGRFRAHWRCGGVPRSIL